MAKIENGKLQSGSDLAALLAPLPQAQLERLVARIDTVPLHAHAYSHHLNLRLASMRPSDMLDFAASHQLCGVNIHVDDGEGRSLFAMTESDQRTFGETAHRLGLRLHVETSSTSEADLQTAVRIARNIGARSIRCYPRHTGRVSEVIRNTIADLRRINAVDPSQSLRFTLEQHEDLKSRELVDIVNAVGNPRLSLLFDFGNMVNAYERPEDALTVMAPFITEVHIKDIMIGEDRGGWSQNARKSGTGELDFHALLCALLLLGDDEPQITAFALQEENGMSSPAYRFPDEPEDPIIPWRAPSMTDIKYGEILKHRLKRERQEAAAQVAFVRMVLEDVRRAATSKMQSQENR